MKNIEKFGIGSITDPIKDTGNKVGNFFTKDIAGFFKNIFGDFSKYLTWISWICCIIACLFCCFLSSPIIMPLLTMGSITTKVSSSTESINF